MPTHEDIIQKITSFNNRYHVNFSLSDFDTACARSNEQLLIQSSNVSTLKKAFIEVLKNLYVTSSKYLIVNALNASEGLNGLMMDLGDIIKDYTTNKSEKFELFDASQQITQKEHQNIAIDALDEINTSPEQIFKDLYLQGNLPIRVMRENVQRNMENKSLTFELIFQGLMYAKALKEVNENRSFLWRIFHPFRNHAEQRDSAMIERMIFNRLQTLDHALNDNDIISDDNNQYIQNQTANRLNMYRNASPLFDFFAQFNDKEDDLTSSNGASYSKEEIPSGVTNNVSTKDQILINETDQIINNLGQKETIIIDFDSSSVTTSPFINNDENHTIKETSLDKK